ncbi:hypothetical protein V5799_009961 [Amblyomma americanum]|uniref:glycerol-3-phosphate dehydrogenase n=1 Tax=Amblyomma americanum TaxID=6943 RepID=A0AAQ4F8W9_AMBAM
MFSLYFAVKMISEACSSDNESQAFFCWYQCTAFIWVQDSPEKHLLDLWVWAEQLEKLRTTLEFDILVLGGGAIACGVALDAATRGLRVALCDIEAIEERQAIFAAAPHLCHSVFVVMPLYDWRKALSVWFYFKTHWYIFSKPNLNENYWLSSTKMQELFPLLRKEGLVGAMVFREATINDIRMNVALALTAARHGAVVANHVGAKRFLKDKSGRLRGAVLRDTLTGDVWPVRAKCVVNATGSGADLLRQVWAPSTKKCIPSAAPWRVVLEPANQSQTGRSRLSVAKGVRPTGICTKERLKSLYV